MPDEKLTITVLERSEVVTYPTLGVAAKSIRITYYVPPYAPRTMWLPEGQIKYTTVEVPGPIPGIKLVTKDDKERVKEQELIIKDFQAFRTSKPETFVV